MRGILDKRDVKYFIIGRAHPSIEVDNRCGDLVKAIEQSEEEKVGDAKFGRIPIANPSDYRLPAVNEVMGRERSEEPELEQEERREPIITNHRRARAKTLETELGLSEKSLPLKPLDQALVIVRKLAKYIWVSLAIKMTWKCRTNYLPTMTHLRVMISLAERIYRRFRIKSTQIPIGLIGQLQKRHLTKVTTVRNYLIKFAKLQKEIRNMNLNKNGRTGGLGVSDFVYL